MRTLLRFLGLFLVIGALGAWLATGMNRGWTKTSVEKKTMDEVTGIEGITYEKRFVPGMDFLGAAVIGAFVLTVISFFFSRKR
jgi:hypothetical protein